MGIQDEWHRTNQWFSWAVSRPKANQLSFPLVHFNISDMSRQNWQQFRILQVGRQHKLDMATRVYKIQRNNNPRNRLKTESEGIHMESDLQPIEHGLGDAHRHNWQSYKPTGIALSLAQFNRLYLKLPTHHRYLPNSRDTWPIPISNKKREGKGMSERR